MIELPLPTTGYPLIQSWDEGRHFFYKWHRNNLYHIGDDVIIVGRDLSEQQPYNSASLQFRRLTCSEHKRNYQQTSSPYYGDCYWFEENKTDAKWYCRDGNPPLSTMDKVIGPIGMSGVLSGWMYEDFRRLADKAIVQYDQDASVRNSFKRWAEYLQDQLNVGLKLSRENKIMTYKLGD